MESVNHFMLDKKSQTVFDLLMFDPNIRDFASRLEFALKLMPNPGIMKIFLPPRPVQSFHQITAFI